MIEEYFVTIADSDSPKIKNSLVGWYACMVKFLFLVGYGWWCIICERTGGGWDRIEAVIRA